MSQLLWAKKPAIYDSAVRCRTIQGELEIETGPGRLKMTRPFAYQEIEGKRVEIAARYRLQGEGCTMQGDASAMTYGFSVAEYNKDYPLIIDPLLASTFIGGSLDDYAGGLAIDSSPNWSMARESAFPM